MSWCRLLASSRTVGRTLLSSTKKCSTVSKSDQITVVSKIKNSTRLSDEITDMDFAFDSKPSILAPNLGTQIDFSEYGPTLPRSQTLAAYVNRSPTLQKLVDLGVDLSIVEKKLDIAEQILKLDFDRDIAKYIQFFTDIGVPADSLGVLFTKNPNLLLEDLEAMQKRIDYLMVLKFEFKDFERLVVANPKWLSFSVEEMEKRVAFFQNEFKLNLPEFRKLALTCPKLITKHIKEIRANSFSIIVEMGFTSNERKSMLMQKPRIWTLPNKDLVERFHFLHNTLKIPHKQIVKQPHALLARLNYVRQRHFFLHSLSKAQYDPALPNYVSLLALVSGSSAEFASNVAGSSADDFSRFLKTM
ncbi:transcription termination factor 3, mitochondrial [Neocloeon triangulifer]|uniref:transcription termination factor 3, mitochondrial n=1 Tax=Neocloeon triangulifer TaxID=2078957 RepID=UPI00286F298A|nr:transcription termination factor 3, mitochondrial [Neocloeon triangulifer]